MKKEKIKLSDVQWVYTDDGSFMIPFIYNSSMNKIKNLNNGNIYEFADGKVIENNEQLRSLIAKSFDKLSSELSFSHTQSLMLDYGLGPIPSFSCLTLSKLNLWVNKTDSYSNRLRDINDFCDFTYASDYSRLTKVFMKGMQKAITEAKKEEKEEEQYQNRFLF